MHTCRRIVQLNIRNHEDKEPKEEEKDLPVGCETGNVLVPPK